MPAIAPWTPNRDDCALYEIISHAQGWRECPGIIDHIAANVDISSVYAVLCIERVKGIVAQRSAAVIGEICVNSAIVTESGIVTTSCVT